LTPSRPTGTADGIGFDRFWKAYPRKVKKTTAAKAWAKIKPDAELVNVIIAAVERQKQSRDWMKNDGEFIPHPTTWLNGERWKDEIEPATGNGRQARHSAGVQACADWARQRTAEDQQRGQG
jgi:hypothetical protein